MARCSRGTRSINCGRLRRSWRSSTGGIGTLGRGKGQKGLKGPKGPNSVCPFGPFTPFFLRFRSSCAGVLLAETFVVYLAYQLPHCAPVYRLRKQIALHVLAIQTGELNYLIASLNTFGDHVHPQIPRESQNGFDYLSVLGKVDSRHK